MNKQAMAWGIPLLCAVAVGAAPASAALVTQTYDFSFSNFSSSINGYLPPANTVTGSFSITFDPTINYGIQYVEYVTTGITLHSLSIALDSPIGFNYDQSLQRLNVGGIESGVDGITFSNSNPVTNDLWFNFRGVAGTPYFQEMSYAQAGIPDVFYSSVGTVSVVTTPVPEPGTLALVLAGLGALVAQRRGTSRRLRAPQAMRQSPLSIRSRAPESSCGPCTP